MTTALNNSIAAQPYLFFGGRCAEAIEFYRARLGAQIGAVMRFRESPHPPPPGVLPAGFDDKIMHCEFTIGSTQVLASDGVTEGTKFHGFSLALSVPSDAEADRIFGLLLEGGAVQMPLGKTFWSSRFGAVTDRFGVSWMVVAPPDTVQ